MSLHNSWNTLLGTWVGTSRLIMPDQADKNSEITAHVAQFAKSTMCAIRYGWQYEDELQEGQILMSSVADSGLIEGVFFDTWHMGPKFMSLRGHVNDSGTTILNGKYEVPDNPDWGWRIEIDQQTAEAWNLRMFNVSPDGEDYLGVDAILRAADRAEGAR